MRKVSKKYQERLRKKKAAYEEFDRNNDGTCKGCGLEKPGSHSHRIPISEAPELESVVENITWHCMSCHTIYESHNVQEMSKMLDFEENMDYIKRVRPMYYERLMMN